MNTFFIDPDSSGRPEQLGRKSVEGACSERASGDVGANDATENV